MTAPTLSLTESQALDALRAFLLAVFPTGMECVRGQDNCVPPPHGTNYAVLTPILRERIETNIDGYADGYPTTPGTKSVLQPVKLTVQVDLYGPTSADNAQIITTLYRDEWAASAFVASGYDVTPLYTSDPHQSASLDGEQQIENRWTLDAVMQCNAVVTISQDFAAALTFAAALSVKLTDQQ